MFGVFGKEMGLGLWLEDGGIALCMEVVHAGTPLVEMSGRRVFAVGVAVDKGGGGGT